MKIAPPKSDTDIDIDEVLRRMPHRPPFLLIDRAENYKPSQSITGIKCVTMNEPFFVGHFPGHPVMPGVLVIEALAQAAAILAYRTTGVKAGDGALFFFAGIDNARFRRQVVPGDQLILEVDVVRIVRGIGKFAARATVDGEIAAEADLMAALRGGRIAPPAGEGG
jgi:3-hydroxyacyl-[acyl-carrier-protein] dehydratase